MSTVGYLLIIIAIIAIIVGIYMIPTIIAFQRNHHYKFIILGINILMGATGIGYLAAFAWAVWPSKTSMLDPIVSSPTSVSIEDGQSIYARWGSFKKSFSDTTVGIDENTDIKTCPYCKETIKKAAIKCKHCGSML